MQIKERTFRLKCIYVKKVESGKQNPGMKKLVLPLFMPLKPEFKMLSQLFLLRQGRYVCNGFALSHNFPLSAEKNWLPQFLERYLKIGVKSLTVLTNQKILL